MATAAPTRYGCITSTICWPLHDMELIYHFVSGCTNVCKQFLRVRVERRGRGHCLSPGREAPLQMRAARPAGGRRVQAPALSPLPETASDAEQDFVVRLRVRSRRRAPMDAARCFARDLAPAARRVERPASPFAHAERGRMTRAGVAEYRTIAIHSAAEKRGCAIPSWKLPAAPLSRVFSGERRLYDACARLACQTTPRYRLVARGAAATL